MPGFVPTGFSPDAVANAFIERAVSLHSPLTPMKLQKLIYFAHGWHLALRKDGFPLVSCEPQAWEYGPVFVDVYHEFKDFGAGAITRKAYDTKFDNRQIVLIEPSLKAESIEDNRLDLPFAEAVIDRVWQVYGRHSGPDLSEMTHERGSPWWTVREEAMKRFGGTTPRGLRIPNQLIREWFKKRFQTLAD